MCVGTLHAPLVAYVRLQRKGGAEVGAERKCLKLPHAPEQCGIPLRQDTVAQREAADAGYGQARRQAPQRLGVAYKESKQEADEPAAA